MSPADWLALLLATGAGAMSPGPSTALVIRHASLSLRAGVACSLSHAAGVGVYAAVAVSGLALALQASVFGWLIAIFGGLWLIWLAVQLWRAPADWSVVPAHVGSAARDGLLMGLVNPKVALFFVAIFAAVLPAAASAWERAAAVGLAMLVDGSWYALISLMLQRAGAVDWLRRRIRLINRVSAIIFTGLALMIVWEMMV